MKNSESRTFGLPSIQRLLAAKMATSRTKKQIFENIFALSIFIPNETTTHLTLNENKPEKQFQFKFSITAHVKVNFQ